MTILKSALQAVALSLCAALPAFAADIEIVDAYFRTARPGAPTGAAFLQIANTGQTGDRLIAVRSPIAARVELHTTVQTDDGVMQMRPLEGGIEVPAGAMAMLQRGGDHVMFMGLSEPYATGASIPLTLVFEGAGEISLQVPVDNERMPAAGMGEMDMDHGDDAAMPMGGDDAAAAD